MKGGIPMKKLLILLLALMLAIPAALAEEIAFSPAAEALRKGYNALMDKYGHTHETLGLFQPHLTRYGTTAFIRYTVGDGNVAERLAGEYFVLVTGDSVQAFWSHDGADVEWWQSGDLKSPAWGVKQLTAYLDESPMTRQDFCEPYAQAEAINQEYAADPFEAVNRENRASAEAAAVQARIALQHMYGLSDEVAQRLDWYKDMSNLCHYRDGHSTWFLMLQDNHDVLDPISYYVTLDADTHEIIRITHASGGIG